MIECWKGSNERGFDTASPYFIANSSNNRRVSAIPFSSLLVLLLHGFLYEISCGSSHGQLVIIKIVIKIVTIGNKIVF